ncbi:Cro/CI family transcriptional regulator [Zooshikella sp. RANM57]|uniref:Cro/CI family transcriptional regulator n=1 Tax=Zooshikella sp. RANM57 TaxID=3425863 RepID=UPI003D6FF21B
MLKTEAINFFGTQVALANLLGISQSAVSKWGNRVPTSRAYQLQVITNGALKAEANNGKTYTQRTDS